MEIEIAKILEHLPLALLFAIIAITIIVLVKGADILVNQAVSLSIKWNVPKVLIGATIVSVGTTFPEAAVSVFAAVSGAPGLALGNAVGSIIADTGLILGLAVIMGRVPVDQELVGRQSWIQAASALLLILACIPYLAMRGMFTFGGRLPQFVGIVFLILLALYIWRSITWSKTLPSQENDDFTVDRNVKSWVTLLKLILGTAMVIIASRLLIPTVEETALRLSIPDAVIAATLVALGTSLPELATAITSVRKGHGELAIGNVLGADVLNVLFVSGAAAAVTKGGLEVPPQFFYLFFPSMLLLVLILRIGIGRTTHHFSKIFGIVLLTTYILTVLLGYIIPEANVMRILD